MAILDTLTKELLGSGSIGAISDTTGADAG